MSNPDVSMQPVGRRILRTALWNGDQRGRHVPVILFNGIGLNLDVMDGIALGLGDRPVMTFDVPGIGGSPEPWLPYTAWSVARWAAILSRRFEFHTVDVIGFSWGGAIAQQFALQHRKRVRRLVCAGMGPTLPFPLTQAFSPQALADRGWVKSLLSDPRRAAFAGVTVQDRSALTPAFLRTLKLPSTRGYLYQLSTLTGWHSSMALPFLDRPTLVVMGANDPIVPLASGQLLQALIPHALLEVVPNAGHLFMFSHQAAFLDLLRDFLGSDKQAGRRAA